MDWGDSVITKGFVGLSVRDESGTIIYQDNVDAGGAPLPASTDQSAIGTWTLVMTWTEAEGSVDLSVAGIR